MLGVKNKRPENMGRNLVATVALQVTGILLFADH